MNRVLCRTLRQHPIARLSVSAPAPTTTETIPLAHTTVPSVADANDAQLPPIVVLHGVLASSATYGSILRRKDFAPNRAKIALDLRNHGRSPHSADTSYTAMADDVAAFLRTNDIERAVVIGHSFGGKTAMSLALREPNLVESLVVVDIAPVTYNPSFDPDGSSAATCLPAMMAADVANAVSRSEVEHTLTTHGVTLPAVRSFLLSNLVSDGDGFRWRCAVDNLYNGLKEVMSFPDLGGARFTGRTMVIRGGKSRYVPFNAMRTHTEMFPNTKLVTLSDAGHWLMSEQPHAFVNQVNRFIDEQQ